MKTEDFLIFIPYDFAVNSSTSGFDIFIFSWLHVATFNTLVETYAFTPETISMMIFGNTTKKKQVQDSLQRMPVGMMDSGVYCVRRDEFEIEKGFVVLPYKYFEQALLMGGVSWAKLIKMIVLIQLGMRRDIKLPNNYLYLNDHPQVWYAKCMGTKQAASIQQYIKRLEDLQIIYVRRSSVPHINNLIGFYQYRDEIDKYANADGSYHITKKKVSSNSKRSLMQKYNQICRGKKYEPEVMEQVRAYILEYNAELDKLQREHPDDDYISQKKDVAVFT